MADRRKLGAKDMAMTMAVVLVVAALIALYGNNVSFAPKAAVKAGDVPTAEVIGGFNHAQATMGFTVFVPDNVPSGWHPNSLTVSDPDVSNSGIAQVGTLKAVRGGWVTRDETFIQLIEAAGEPSAVLVSEFEGPRAFSGTVDAGGAEWRVTTGVREQAAWVRAIDTPTGVTTLLITGSASESDFRRLADAVSHAD